MTTKELIVTDREKIRIKWGKTESDVKEYIQILRDWLKSCKHLPEEPDDNTIEYLLTNCKYSIEKTKQNIDWYYTARNIIYFHPLKSPHQELMAKMAHYVVLPKLTEDLCRVVFMKYNEYGVDAFNFENILAHGLNMFEVRVHEDLVVGDIYVFDLQHLQLPHILRVTPAVLKKLSLILEKVWSNRLKEVHLFNYPSYIDKGMTVAKMCLKPKLYDRIKLHPNQESLFKSIPQELLPGDYGGQEKTLQELTDLWELKFQEYEKRFDDLEKLRVNESLRPEPLTNSEILGYYGNFKKMDVD